MPPLRPPGPSPAQLKHRFSQHSTNPRPLNIVVGPVTGQSRFGAVIQRRANGIATHGRFLPHSVVGSTFARQTLSHTQAPAMVLAQEIAEFTWGAIVTRE